MKMKFGLALAAMTLCAVAAFASVESGLKPGRFPSPFEVVDVTGPNKGKTLCYRCQYGASPVVAAFVNGDVTKSTELLVELQKLVDSNKAKGLKGFVVVMNGPEAKTSILKIAAEKKLTLPMVYLPHGTKEDDIASYKINPEAKNTVLLWRQSTIKGNFVDVDTTNLVGVKKAVGTMLQ